MTLKIPSSFRGTNGKEAYEKIINEKVEIEYKPEKINSSKLIKLNSNIVSSDYIQIPNQNFAMAIAETNFNLNYENAHKTTLKQDLEIPRPHEFMIFHNYIIDCYKNKIQIFDASGNPVSDKIKKDIYTQLTSNCWTWLNGKFDISGKKKIIEYITSLDSNDNLLAKSEDLENCLMKDEYIDFKNLTKQGLAEPNSKSSNQKFKIGENIYFYYPRDKMVAGFVAGSGRAYLSCGRNPSGTYSSLGVRAILQGSSPMLAGGIK